MYPILITFDRSFFTNYLLIQEWQHSDGNTNEAGKFFQKVGRTVTKKTLGVVGPGKYHPSTILCVLAIMSLFVVIVPMYILLYPKGADNRNKLFQEYVKVKELESIVGGIAGSAKNLDEFQYGCGDSVGKEDAVLRANKVIPMMRLTCELVGLRGAEAYAPEKRKRMLNWIKKCERPEGGFSPCPEAKADVVHTSAAIHLWSQNGLELQHAENTHVEWLLGGLLECIAWGNRMAEEIWLEHVKLSLSSLALLNALDRIAPSQRELVAEEAALRWRRSRRTPQQTRNMLEILDLLGANRKSVLRQVEQEWLPFYEQVLPTLKPDAELPTIVELCAILRYMCPDSFERRDAVIQAVDNVRRVYGEGERI